MLQLAPPKLVDLQICALTSAYLQTASAPHAAWLVVGLGLRFAQDVGVHREKAHAGNVFENQIWKRVFW